MKIQHKIPSFPSELQRQRLNYKNTLPHVLQKAENRKIVKGQPTSAAGDQSDIKRLFPNLYGQKSISFTTSPTDNSTSNRKAPLRAAVVLSGGQAPGGHNVIGGIYRFVKENGGVLFGFRNGPKGIMTGNYVELNDEMVSKYLNMGGFDIIGSGRDKIHSDEQFASSLQNCEAMNLNGLVVIGGDDSNTNACMLAEYFASKGSKISVVGAPKTIDGDLKNEYVPVSFGFDTACKVYSEMIGSLAMDALSSKKKYHFVRLMGRSASHIALECALQVQPNLCFIGEEVQKEKMTLAQITNQLVKLINQRSKLNKHFGLVLIPEGLIEFIPELGILIEEINDILSNSNNSSSDTSATQEFVLGHLSKNSAEVFKYLPDSIRAQLLLDRDSHGNVIVSRIETEKLIVQCAMKELEKDVLDKFKCQFHFFGYEGRSAMPSLFDSNYCFALGYNAGLLIENQCSGMISTIGNLSAPAINWTAGGMPLTHMMNIERRAGKEKPVIKKALTELLGKPFLTFVNQRLSWMVEDCYRSPGPIQFSGPGSEDISITLRLELEQRAAEKKEATNENAKRVKYNNDSNNNNNEVPSVKTCQGRNVQASLSLPLSQYRAAHKVTMPYILKNPGLAELKITSCVKLNNIYGYDLQRKFPSLCSESTNLEINEIVNGENDCYGVKVEPEESVNAKPSQRVGIVFCGRPTPGAHNIIEGLFNGIKSINNDSVLIGFKNGTVGLFENQSVVITNEMIDTFRNSGGLDILGRTVDQMAQPKQLAAILKTCKAQRLDGLVCVGGTYTAADSLELAEYLKANGCPETTITQIPATIDRDMVNAYVQETVGFHTASHVCSQLVGNISTDCNSNKKYYYFLRMMGRRPSHIALEVGLQCCPNAVLIGEEIWEEQKTLSMIVNELSDMICARALKGKNYGVILVPEGLLTFIPEIASLLNELKQLGIKYSNAKDILGALSPWQKALYDYLPSFIQKKLLKREIHGTIAWSQIETERMLLELVKMELSERKKLGTYKGKFGALTHFFGYQARCGYPSEFDATYGSCLGVIASILIRENRTGYMCCMENLHLNDVEKWKGTAIPLLELCTMNRKTNRAEYKPVVVDLNRKPFQYLLKSLQTWKDLEDYRNPGPIQINPSVVSNGDLVRSMTLKMEHEDQQV